MSDEIIGALIFVICFAIFLFFITRKREETPAEKAMRKLSETRWQDWWK